MVKSEIEPLDDSEKNKIFLQHKLSIRKLVVDRLLIGLLIGVAGFIGTLLIEKYKADTTQTQFFLEKRLAATMEIRKIFSEVTSQIFNITEVACNSGSVSSSLSKNLVDTIDKKINVINSSSLLLEKHYLDATHRVAAIFLGVADYSDRTSCSSRPFISHIADYFTYETKQQIGVNGNSDWSGFVPIGLSPSEIDDIGRGEYFLQNFEAWNSYRSD